MHSKHKRSFIILFFLLMVTSLAEMVSIGAIIPFLTVLVEAEKFFHDPNIAPLLSFFEIKTNSEFIFFTTISFCFLVLLSAGLKLLLLNTQIRFSHSLGVYFSSEIFKNIISQDYQYHITNNSSDYISNITSKIDSLVGGIIIPLVTLISSGFILLSIISVLMFVDFVASISAIVFLFSVYLALSIFIKRKIHINGEISNSKTNKIYRLLSESFGSVRDLIIDKSQQKKTTEYTQLDLAKRKAIGTNQILGSSPKFVIEGIGIIVISLLGYFLVISGVELTKVIPILGLVVLSLQRALPLAQQIYSALMSVRSNNPILVELTKYLSLKVNSKKDKSKKLKFNHSIKLEVDKFLFGEGTPSILNNLYLEIRKGAIVGLVGESGSGKSTLIDILLGLLSFEDKCRLYVDKVLVDRGNINSWHARIAHVPQEIYLMDCSILRNITLGNETDSVDMNRLIEAAKIANIHDFILSLEDGYESNIGEHGAKLSGGQRQRLGLARALYKEADVLILDEATSALDGKNVEIVLKNVINMDKNKTIIMVSHDLSSLALCDFVYEVINGGIKTLKSF